MSITNRDDDFDERGILKDKRSIRVPLFAMDSVQKAIATEDELRKVIHEYDENGRQKSSFHYADDKAMRALEDASAKRQAFSDAARATAMQDQAQAWKRPWDGEIEAPTKASVVVAPTKDSASIKDAQATRDAAYAKSLEDRANAWRST